MRLRIKAGAPFLPGWKFKLFAGIICVAGIVYTATRLIKSDRELIAETIRFGARAVERGDVASIAPFVSKHYYGYYGKNREEAIERARRDLKLIESISIRIKRIDIKFNATDEADVVCYFFVSGYFTGADIYNRIYFRGIASENPEEPERAEFIFRREKDGIWRLVEAELQY